MHPDQYRMGYQVMRQLAHYPRVQECLTRWPSIFNALTVVSNRGCPMHRDHKGSFPLFDILASTGHYSSAPWLVMPLGLQLPNRPGSICGVSGKAFRHGAVLADGPRLCHAFYMRKELQDFTNVLPCSWMTQDVYSAWMGTRIDEEKFHINPHFLYI